MLRDRFRMPSTLSMQDLTRKKHIASIFGPKELCRVLADSFNCSVRGSQIPVAFMLIVTAARRRR
jgi:hypothetical protein